MVSIHGNQHLSFLQVQLFKVREHCPQRTVFWQLCRCWCRWNYFATNFHNDVYVFQATTATNTSTTLSIFENPYYFEFEPSASQISSVATAAQFFNLVNHCQYREIFWLLWKKYWRKCKQRFGSWCHQCYTSVSKHCLHDEYHNFFRTS